jgi:hypothetical protein
MIDKVKLYDFLEIYCKENNLSFEKLKSQQRGIGSYALFGYPRNIEANGLLNDIDTQPYPTLLVEPKDDTFIVIKTEYTKKYLS